MRIPFAKPLQLVTLGLSVMALAAGSAQVGLAKGAPKARAQAVAARPAAPTTLTWSSDLRSALTVAQSSRRWVLVDCFTEHCGWCKRMDRDTFSSPDVARDLGNSFVWVKCDTDNPVTGRWVRDKYEPQGYPCILILDPYGTEKGRILGYAPPEQFISRVAGIVRK